MKDDHQECHTIVWYSEAPLLLKFGFSDICFFAVAYCNTFFFQSQIRLEEVPDKFNFIIPIFPTLAWVLLSLFSQVSHFSCQGAVNRVVLNISGFFPHQIVYFSWKMLLQIERLRIEDSEFLYALSPVISLNMQLFEVLRETQCSLWRHIY